MSVGEDVVPGGARFKPRVYNYELYHVGANLITNSLYCQAFQNWLYSCRERSLPGFLSFIFLSTRSPRDQRGTKRGEKERQRDRRPENNVLMMKERNFGESVSWKLCVLPMLAIAFKRDQCRR